MPRTKLVRPLSEVELKNIFAKNLRNALSELNMNQADLASSMQVNRSLICRWLNGDHAPGFESLARISNELGLEPSYFLSRPSTKVI